MRRRGFTIIELLVVLTIIALLVSLIVPALASARGTARTVQDSDHLRQITLAWLRYQQTSSEQMMPWMIHNLKTEPNYVRYWFGGVDNSVKPPTLNFNDGFLAPFLEAEKRIFLDPDFDFDSLTETRFDTLTTGYAYNKTLGPGTTYQYDAAWNIIGVLPPGHTANGDPGLKDGTIVPPVGLKYGAIQHTASTVVFADSAIGLDSTYQNTGLRENWSLDKPDPGADWWVAPTLHFRHSGRLANVSFADGHVEQVRYVKVPQTLWNSYGTGPSTDMINWFDTKSLAFYGADNSAYTPQGK